ncbi:hypothetical protein MM239_17245 [Belliella sp. DSM 111904]|uniref:Uncharacterized protein n=1 Tax=Belliella filtrata TaxID=2923435 RepID=A0ABS9V412_9BACT|nr:hypothetical protein [Belliella filtrata]MCH7411147.1 hypothetical protein [Belliella filtrata]
MTWLKDLNEFFKERLSNPFFFTFAFFWIIWNWQGIAYFFYSTDDILFRLGCINDTYVDIYRNLLYPLALAIASIILSNGFFLIVEFLPDKFIFKRKKRLYKRLENQFLEKEKVAIAEAKYNIARTEAKTIEELKLQVTTLESTVSKYSKEKSSLDNRINDLLSDINIKTQYIGKLERSVNTETIDRVKLTSFITEVLKIILNINTLDNETIHSMYKQIDESTRNKFYEYYHFKDDLDSELKNFLISNKVNKGYELVPLILIYDFLTKFKTNQHGTSIDKTP